MSKNKSKTFNALAAEDELNPKACARLKELVRKWYGKLSVKEIITNSLLIKEIEALERMLSRKEAL